MKPFFSFIFFLILSFNSNATSTENSLKSNYELLFTKIITQQNYILTEQETSLIFEYAALRKTNIYDISRELSLRSFALNGMMTISGNILRNISQKFDIGGEDGRLVFASNELIKITFGKNINNNSNIKNNAEIRFYLSQKLFGSVSDVKEPYSLSMEKEFGYLNVHDDTLEECFGFRGGLSIFTLPFLYFKIYPNNQMLMKLKYLPASRVEVNPIIKY